jgi:ketosteroid isomerase-like protein
VQSHGDQLKAKVREYIERVWNQKQVDALDELASPSYRRHLGPAAPGSGTSAPSIDRAAQKARLRGLQDAMPDVHFAVDDLIAEGDRVVFRVTVTGTQRGVMFGVPPTGKFVAYTAIDILRFEAGLIVEHWGFGDSAALLRQIGGISG